MNISLFQRYALQRSPAVCVFFPPSVRIRYCGQIPVTVVIERQHGAVVVSDPRDEIVLRAVPRHIIRFYGARACRISDEIAAYPSVCSLVFHTLHKRSVYLYLRHVPVRVVRILRYRSALHDPVRAHVAPGNGVIRPYGDPVLHGDLIIRARQSPERRFRSGQAILPVPRRYGRFQGSLCRFKIAVLRRMRSVAYAL